MLNVRDFGAVGDGKRDDTAAIQKALDAAAETQGTALVPPGVFPVSTLKVHSRTGLAGEPAWSYRDFGGSILRLIDRNAPCLVDLTGAVGVTVNGLCLDGTEEGRGHAAAFVGAAHGILIGKPDTGKEEDHVRIERCRIGNFGGDGIHLANIWCWTVRHSMVCFNGGNAIYALGWDGFALDNWLSGNAGAGLCTDAAGACTTITANRIEWNREGGIVIRGGMHYNITGNFIDRSGKSGIRLAPSGTRASQVFTITGNVIWRSGRPEWVGANEYDSSQVWIEDTAGLTFTGNALNVWRDDGPRGSFSPRFGIVVRGLASSVIKDNALHGGSLERLVVDLGGHGEGVIVADNPGSLFVPPVA